MTVEPLYPIIHLQGEDIEIALTHTNQSGEEYHSFVNGQHTIQGGTHQVAFREAIARTIKEFFSKNQEYSDIRNGVVGAIAINVSEPVFESQTKVKLGSKDMSPEGGLSVNKFVGDFIKQQLDNYLHKHPEVVEVMLQKIQESEKERKAIAGVTKAARERAKKNLMNNPKLRDCQVHYNDAKPSPIKPRPILPAPYITAFIKVFSFYNNTSRSSDRQIFPKWNNSRKFYIPYERIWTNGIRIFL